MVYLAAHGGGCCGARHIHSFTTTEENNPNLIDRQVSAAINGQSIEVILNGDQVARHPRVLERLDQLGFVLTDHWRNGNHGNPGTHNYRFIRCDRRERLLTGPIADRWTGMVNHPGLEGNLTPMHGTVGAVAAAANNEGLRGPATETAAHRQHFTRPLPEGNLFDWGGDAAAQVGDTVRVNSYASRRYGRDFVVARTTDEYLFMHDDRENGVEFRITRYNCLITRRAAQQRQDNVYQEGEYRPGARVIIRNAGAGYLRGRMGTIARGSPVLRHDNPGNTVVGVVMDTQNPTGTGSVGFYRSNIIILNDNDTIPRIAPMAVPGAPPAQAVQPQRHNNVEVFEGMAPREVAPAQPVVVFRTYHNVYRDGRVGAGYDTLEDARNARNGNGRIDRRDISSDGTTVFVENVHE